MQVDPRRVIQRLVRRSSRPAPRGLSIEGPPVAVRLPATHQAAAQSLVNRDIANGIALSNRVLATSTEGADDDILRFSQALLRDLRKRGLPFFPHIYFRNEETQNRLRKQGVSKAKWGQSAHNFGMAVDIVHFGKYWDLTPLQWAVIGLIGKEVARRLNLKVTWGGDWKFYDPAHWELSDWKKRMGML